MVIMAARMSFALYFGETVVGTSTAMNRSSAWIPVKYQAKKDKNKTQK